MVSRTKKLTYPAAKVCYRMDTRFDPVFKLVTNSYTENNLSGGFETISGSNNPSYKVKIAAGVDASSSYLKRSASATPLFASASSFQKGGGYTVYFRGSILTLSGAEFVGLGDYPSTDSDMLDIALSRLKSKLRQQVGDLALLTPIGELSELRHTIRGTAEMATGLMKALINIKRTKGRSALKYASHAWLNFGFGVAPLINETKQIAESIAALQTRQGRVARLTGKSKKDWITGVKTSGQSADNYSSLSTTSDSSHQLSYMFVAGMDLTILSSNDYGALQHLHTDIGGLVPTAWELTPYSWVVDYFTTVGAFLDDAFTSSPGTTKYCTLSRKYTCQTRLSGSSSVVFDGTNALTSSHCEDGFVDFYEFERSVYTTLPHRALRVKSLDEIGLGSVKKLLNLASVLIQRGRG